MDEQEHQNWSNWMKSRQGKWSIDPVHDGINRDLIMFLPDEDDFTQGSFMTASGSTIEVGKYEHSYSSVTDGEFKVEHGLSLLNGPRDNNHGMARPSREVWEFISSHADLTLLTGITKYLTRNYPQIN